MLQDGIRGSAGLVVMVYFKDFLNAKWTKKLVSLDCCCILRKECSSLRILHRQVRFKTELTDHKNIYIFSMYVFVTELSFGKLFLLTGGPGSPLP